MELHGTRGTSGTLRLSSQQASFRRALAWIGVGAGRAGHCVQAHYGHLEGSQATGVFENAQRSSALKSQGSVRVRGGATLTCLARRANCDAWHEPLPCANLAVGAGRWTHSMCWPPMWGSPRSCTSGTPARWGLVQRVHRCSWPRAPSCSGAAGARASPTSAHLLACFPSSCARRPLRTPGTWTTWRSTPGPAEPRQSNPATHTHSHILASHLLSRALRMPGTWTMWSSPPGPAVASRQATLPAETGWERGSAGCSRPPRRTPRTTWRPTRWAGRVVVGLLFSWA